MVTILFIPFNRKIGQRTFRQVTGYQNLEELTTRLSDFSYRVLKKECLDLPDKVYQKREVILTPDQKRIYKELKDYAIAELESHEMVSVTSILTQILRLHQVVCGFVKHDNNKEVEIKNNRLDALPDDERQKVITRFQDPDSTLQYLVSNVQTGGYGITLTQASNVIYYSNNYDLEKRLQSEDRAHRIGQTNKVTYIDLVSKGTVDEKIVKALRNKLDLAQEVLGDEKWKDWIG